MLVILQKKGSREATLLRFYLCSSRNLLFQA